MEEDSLANAPSLVSRVVKKNFGEGRKKGQEWKVDRQESDLEMNECG